MDTPDSSLVDIARDMVPELQSRAAEIEENNCLPDDLAERMLAHRFYHMMVPEAVGGLELNLPAFIRVMETLAEGDASAAWNAMACTNTGYFLGHASEEAGKEIIGSGGVLAGVVAPNGKAQRVEGGYRATGKWTFGSGSKNATYLAAGCMVMGDDGEFEKTDAGGRNIRIMLVPRSEVILGDDWHVSGLSGTGSVEFSIEDVFVPEAYTTSLLDKPYDTTFFRFPTFCTLAAGFPGIAIGNARAAIDEFVSIAGGKTPAGTKKPLAEKESTQLILAESEAKLRSARSWLYATFEEAWALTELGKEVPIELRRDMRTACIHASRTSAEVIDAMFQLAGSTGIYKRSPLQRRWRDAHVITKHMLVSTSTLALAGQYYLGEDNPAVML